MKNGQVVKEVLEQYFTPVDLADKYALKVVELVGKDNKFIEPTAGSGVFVDALVKAGVDRNNITAYDLDPKREDIIQEDVFNLEGVEDCVVIGNFPYGKGGSLAIKIMNSLVGKGVKQLFLLNPICIGHKHHTLKTLDEHLHLENTLEYPEGRHFTYLTEHDTSKPNPVRCEFQHWVVKDTSRPAITSVRETEMFTILQPGTNKVKDEAGRLREQGVGEIPADFTIISHGKNAGKVIDFEPDHKANVKMFVQVKNGFDASEVRKMLEDHLNNENLTQWSTIAHNPSIAPSELIYSLQGK